MRIQQPESGEVRGSMLGVVTKAYELKTDPNEDILMTVQGMIDDAMMSLREEIFNILNEAQNPVIYVGGKGINITGNIVSSTLAECT